MKQMITTDRYDAFSCIGGACPYNCCRSDWKKDVTEEEYAVFLALEHPYRDTILASIEGEAGKRHFKMCDGHCGLLTADGWCGLVQHFGDEILPFVCQTFPRSVARFGDITEYGVEIACPPVAEYLFADRPIAIRKTGEEDGAINIPERYRLLGSVRDRLIELFHRESPHYSYGKLFILYTILYRLRGLITENRLSAETTAALNTLISSEELVSGAFAQDETLRADRKRRCLAARNVQVIQETIGFARSHEKVLPDDAPWRFLAEICADGNRLEQELRDHLTAFETEYPHFTENYFIHALFQDWIDPDPQSFGERMVVRAFEYSLILMLGMAEKKVRGELPVAKYALLISWVERMIIHNNAVPGIVMRALEHAGISDAAAVFAILI